MRIENSFSPNFFQFLLNNFCMQGTFQNTFSDPKMNYSCPFCWVAEDNLNKYNAKQKK